MSDVETGWFRLEGGTIQEMDLPLHEAIEQRVAKGEIVRVANTDGDAWQAPTPLPEVTPEEAQANMADVHANLGKALDRVAELEDALAGMTKDRDDTALSLADVTRARDELQAAAEQRQAGEKAKASAKPKSE